VGSAEGRRAESTRAGAGPINIQVFGFQDCQDTRKALRFFAERRIAVHFVDLKERPAAKGELKRFADRFGPAALVDKDSATYKAMGLRVALDSPQRLLERALVEPRLLRTPLVRNGGKVAIGHTPDEWQVWLDADKKRP
jgi:arsenate reductase